MTFAPQLKCCPANPVDKLLTRNCLQWLKCVKGEKKEKKMEFGEIKQAWRGPIIPYGADSIDRVKVWTGFGFYHVNNQLNKNVSRGLQLSLFSEERETTTYLKQAQVQNRLYNREPVQLLCDNRFQKPRSPSLTTAANGKKRAEGQSRQTLL